MTRTRRKPQFLAVVLILSLVAVLAPAISGRASASGNTFTETDAELFLRLYRGALALHRDINESMSVLSRSRAFDQASCLAEMGNSVTTMMDELWSTFQLIKLSAAMRDSVDEAMVNTTLAGNAPLAVRELAEARRYSIAQGALCPTSALVSTYAQKTAALADDATTVFSGINDRVGGLVHQ